MINIVTGGSRSNAQMDVGGTGSHHHLGINSKEAACLDTFGLQRVTVSPESRVDGIVSLSSRRHGPRVILQGVSEEMHAARQFMFVRCCSSLPTSSTNTRGSVRVSCICKARSDAEKRVSLPGFMFYATKNTPIFTCMVCLRRTQTLQQRRPRI